MAAISKAEKTRRERVNEYGVKKIRKILTECALKSGDPIAFKKRSAHARMVEEAIAGWTPPKPVDDADEASE